MRDKRYIPCKCLHIKQHDEFIPFWELSYEYDEEMGEYFKSKDHYQRYYGDLIDCYWDIKDKKVLFGLIKDIYPKDAPFKLDEVVLVEVAGKYGTMKEDKVVEIFYENYETSIRKLKKMEKYELTHYFSKEELKEAKLEDIYEIRTWSPSYKLQSGDIIHYTHQMKHKL